MTFKFIGKEGYSLSKLKDIYKIPEIKEKK